MTPLTLQRPSLLQHVQALWTSLRPHPRLPASPADDTRARPEIVLDLLDRNPDAFQCEMDIMDLAHLYRCQV